MLYCCGLSKTKPSRHRAQSLGNSGGDSGRAERDRRDKRVCAKAAVGGHGPAQGQPRWRPWPRPQKPREVGRRGSGHVVIKRNARERGPQRRHLASDDSHDPGIKGMFLQNRRERGKEKGDQRKMSHELMGRAGHRGADTGQRARPLAASPLPGGLLGWEQIGRAHV